MLSRLMGWRFLEVALLSINRYFFTGNRDMTMITSKATMTMLKMNALTLNEGDILRSQVVILK